MNGATQFVSGARPKIVGVALLISLAGTVRLESGDRAVDEQDLGGRQVRLALAYVVAERPAAVSRYQLADLLWPEQLPRSWESALRSVMSKVRAAFGSVGLPASEVLTVAFGCYQLRLPPQAIVDVEAAEASVAAAESALATGDLVAACDHAMAAHATATKPFLPGEEGEWVDRRRAVLRGLLLRALDTLGEARARRGETALAVKAAEEAVALDPYREHAHRLLMSAHATAGDRAQALRDYEHLRRLLAEELGVEPSPETEAAYVALLRQGPDRAVTPPVGVGSLPLAPGASAPLAGREAELAVLDAAWSRARARRRQVVLLEGEAGIGKTALAIEAARRAHEAGATALYGRCNRQPLRPYEPFAAAVVRYVAACPPAQLTRELTWAPDDLARLAPEIAARVGVLAGVPATDAEEARHRMFAALASFLTEVASDAPTVFVLDDVHWAGPATVLLLRYLARALERVPVLFVVTYRPEEIPATSAVSDALQSLLREAGGERLGLTGLDDAAVASLLRATGPGGSAGDAALLAPRLREQTGGNAFFLTEVISQLVRDAAASPRQAPAEVPARVLDVVTARLAGLTDTAREVVRLAAVVGHDFDVSVIERASGLDADEALDALEEAREARLLTEGAHVGHYRFLHGLVADAIHDDLPPTRRAQLHLQVAEALETGGDASSSDHARLARHLRLASPLADASRIAGSSLRAGDDAMAHLAYEQAAAHYEDAVGATDLAAGGEPLERCHALVGLAGALRRAGRVGAARDAYLEATRLAREIGDAGALAACALGLGGGGRGTSAWVADEVRIALLEEALAALGSEQNELRVRVLAELAKALYFTGQRRRREALLLEAVAAARRVGRPAALVAALSASRVLRWGPDNTELRLACAEEMVEVAEASGDLVLSIRAHLAWLVDLVEVGDRTRFDSELTRALSLADDLGQPYYRWRAFAWDATRAVIDGRWRDADERHGEAMAVWSEIHADAEAWDAVYSAMSLALRGAASEGIAALRSVAVAQPAIPSLRCLLAWVAAEAGDRDVARQEFERFAVDGFTSPPPDGQWLGGVCALAETCAVLDDVPRADALHQLLLPYERRMAVLDAFGGGGVFLGSVAHALAVLAATMGRLDEAERHVRTAREANARFGATPFVARTHQPDSG